MATQLELGHDCTIDLYKLSCKSKLEMATHKLGEHILKKSVSDFHILLVRRGNLMNGPNINYTGYLATALLADRINGA